MPNYNQDHQGQSVRRLVTATSVPGVQLRTATYDGREHLIVPVIALIGDSVIRPLHSDGPEFVPASELAVAPAQWNGRYVVPNHPNDGLDTANDPVTLSANRYGQVFNARFEDNKLKLDVYLDPVRAEEVGAGWVLADLRAGRMVEVSVGAWVTLEKVSGISPSGTVYDYRWRGLISDHLAVGLDGSTGACSVDMGCGALRTARSKELSMALPLRVMEAVRNLFVNPATTTPVTAAGTGGKSDVELRDQLGKALRATEPGFDWVLEVFTKRGGGQVVYMAMPEDRMMYLRRSFTMADGEVALSDDREEVEQESNWKPIAAAASTEVIAVTAGEGCQCHKSAVATADPNPAVVTAESVTATEGEPVMPDAAAVVTAANTATPVVVVPDTVKALVGRLIACEASPFTDADRPQLESWPVNTLTDLDTTYTKLANPSTTVATTSPVVVAAAVEDPKQAEARWLTSAPPAVRDMFTKYQAAEATHRARLVTAISGLQGSSAYTLDHLNAKDTDELERLAKALRASTAVDFGGRALPVAAESAGNDTGYPDPPDIYKIPAAGTVTGNGTVQ